MTLTPIEYAEKSGLRCPVCEGNEIEGGSIQVDAGIAWQGCQCLDCDATWDDMYELVGYRDLEAGKS